MDLWHVAILSAIEGLTEFLPISSTGHLILASKILNLEQNNFLKTFEIVVQFGAILAVVVLYYRKFLVNFDIYKNLFVAFLPTALVGFFLYPVIKNYFFESTEIVIWSLFIGGIFLILFDKFFKITNRYSLSASRYFLIGLFQSLSVIPGVSRSASTIIGGMLMGLSKKKALEFSFLLAVPTMLSATLYDLYKSSHLFNSQEFVSLSTGFVLSFIFAMLAIKFFVNFVNKNGLGIFGVYRIILAIAFWLLVK